MGWEPTETHEHFYEDGLLVRTVVTREPEWDDEQRNLMLALAQYKAELCDCGNHISLTDDPSNVFQPTERVCAVCAGADRYTRVQQEADEKAIGEKPSAHTPRPSDGRRTYMRLLPPDEVAAARAKRQPD